MENKNLKSEIRSQKKGGGMCNRAVALCQRRFWGKRFVKTPLFRDRTCKNRREMTAISAYPGKNDRMASKPNKPENVILGIATNQPALKQPPADHPAAL
jgi:hypothetical protein